MTALVGMMARVGIESEALLDFKGENRIDMNTQKALTRLLTEYGFVDLMGVNDANALTAAIGQLPPDVRTVWIKTLKGLYDLNRFRCGERHETMTDICNAEQLPEDFHKQLNLVVVSKQVAEKREIPVHTGYATRVCEPELSLADSVDHCTTIERARVLRERGNFPAGSSRNEIWTNLFKLPAELSAEVTLLDGYFFHYNLQRKGAPRDHVTWFIRELNRTLLEGSSLRLLCQLPEGSTVLGLEQTVQDLLSPIVGSGRLASIHVVLAPARGSTRLPHNRHLRFSCGAAITSDEGFDRLGRSKIDGVEGFSWKAVMSAEMLGEFSRREDQFLKSPKRVEIQVNARSSSRQ